MLELWVFEVRVSNEHPVKLWIRSHASMFFVGCCLLTGLVCILIGQSLDPSQNHGRLWSNVLTSLGGSIFAFSLTVVFFNIGDMRKYFDERLAQLFSQPDIIKNFNAEKRKEISRLALEGGSPNLLHIPRELSDFLHAKNLEYLSLPIAENYNYSAVIRPGHSSDWVVNHYTLRYRIVTSHLHASKREIPFKFEFTWQVTDQEGTDIDWIPEFKLRVGDKTFSRADLKLSCKKSGGFIEYHAIFEENISVPDDTYVAFESKASGSVNESVDICKVKFPTRGIRAELTHEAGLMYDAMIFKCDGVNDSLASDEITLRDNSISICTDTWLLPGNGFSISFRKP